MLYGLCRHSRPLLVLVALKVGLVLVLVLIFLLLGLLGLGLLALAELGKDSSSLFPVGALSPKGSTPASNSPAATLAGRRAVVASNRLAQKVKGAVAGNHVFPVEQRLSKGFSLGPCLPPHRKPGCSIFWSGFLALAWLTTSSIKACTTLAVGGRKGKKDTLA
jgi:hypothetical protein